MDQIMRLSEAERTGLSQMFSKMGRRGGIARAAKLTPEQRSAVALRAALTRWRNQEKKGVAK